MMEYIHTHMIFASLSLLLLVSTSLSANEYILDGGAALPQTIEYNYMLEQVKKKGANGDEYGEYVRQCNDSGICRFMAPAETTRSVVNKTPFGTQTVIYPP